MITKLEQVIDEIIKKEARDSNRLAPLADFVREQFSLYGLPNVRGGSDGELNIQGMARPKKWDVAYEFAGKNRLLVSLKSIWRNAGGTVPNRIDDLIGETANVQQMAPEIVIGYILLFDTQVDSKRRDDGLLWSEYFEQSVRRIAIRRAPLWNQGLLEGCWFIRFDSSEPYGNRIQQPERVEAHGMDFFRSLLQELRLREPAIPFTSEV